MPISLGRVTPPRLRLLTQGHLCRFSVRSRGILPGGLFTGPGDRPDRPLTGGPSRLRPVLPITGLPGLHRLDGATAPPGLPRGVGRRASRCRAYPRGTGILTCFPFGRSVLPPALGPTYPRLTNIAEEPWPLRRRGFSPRFAATTGGILVPDGSTGPHGPASEPPGRPPTGPWVTGPWSRGFWGRLQPRPF